MAISRTGDSYIDGERTEDMMGAPEGTRVSAVMSAEMTEYSPTLGRTTIRAGSSAFNPYYISILGLTDVIKELRAIDKRLTIAVMKVIPQLCDRVAKMLRNAIGRYFPGMPRLEPETIALHTKAGTGDTPLLFTKTLRDSIKVEQMELDVRGVYRGISMSVISDDEHLRQNMYGDVIHTKKGYVISIPPRDPITPTLDENESKIIDMFSSVVDKAFGGDVGGRIRDTFAGSWQIVDNDQSEEPVESGEF